MSHRDYYHLPTLSEVLLLFFNYIFPLKPIILTIFFFVSGANIFYLTCKNILINFRMKKKQSLNLFFLFYIFKLQLNKNLMEYVLSGRKSSSLIVAKKSFKSVFKLELMRRKQSRVLQGYKVLLIIKKKENQVLVIKQSLDFIFN